jgi:hypothetical protein
MQVHAEVCDGDACAELRRRATTLFLTIAHGTT